VPENQGARRSRVEPCAGCPTYVCPTSGERECPIHGGFDVCCDHPQCPGARQTGDDRKRDTDALRWFLLGSSSGYGLGGGLASWPGGIVESGVGMALAMAALVVWWRYLRKRYGGAMEATDAS